MTLKKYDVSPLFDIRTEHGEGPIWDEVKQKLYWVDILKGDFYKGDINSLEVKKYSIGQPIGSLALREPDGLVMAVRDGFGFFNEDNLQFNLVNKSPEKHNKEVRFNDGAVDSKGRFFAGTMEWDGKSNTGKLFRLNQDHSYAKLDDNFFIPNGMGWNLEKNIYYVIDTFRHALFAYDYDLLTGNISNPREHIKFRENEFPDGMAVDAEGGFWVAMWGGYKIVRFDNIGKKIEEIQVPVPHPTSCCFGGENMKTLFITSSRIALNPKMQKKHELAGRTFRMETDTLGQFETKYKG